MKWTIASEMRRALNRMVSSKAPPDEMELMDLCVLPGAGNGHSALVADPAANVVNPRRRF
jgi:hypothetical protein